MGTTWWVWRGTRWWVWRWTKRWVWRWTKWWVWRWTRRWLWRWTRWWLWWWTKWWLWCTTISWGPRRIWSTKWWIWWCPVWWLWRSTGWMGNSLKVAMEVPLQLQVAVMEVPLQQEQTIPRHPLVAMEVLVNMVNLLTDNQLVPHMVELDLTIVQQDMLPLQHLPMAQQAQRHLPVTLLVVVVVVDMDDVNKAGVKSLCSSLIFYVCRAGYAAYWS